MTITQNKLSILTFASKRLAFHLHEVMQIIRIADVIPIEINLPFVLGTVNYADRKWPVFGLNEQFIFVEKIPTTYAYGICITADHGHTGLVLLGETITNLVLETELQLIPKCIRSANNPLQYWCWYDDNLLSIIDTAALTLYITHKIENVNVCIM